MTGMRLGGVDPSILRELSGVYKPFIKAVKELVSNAYDADAERVTVSFADEFTSVTVTDDGGGMSPFEFRTDFTRIGGGSRRWSGDRTRKNRLRIGSKGIGFLALARYCDQLKVRSTADRSFKSIHRIPQTPKTVDIASVLAVPMAWNLLTSRLKVRVEREGKSIKLKQPRDYSWDRKKGRLSVKKDIGPVLITIDVDCSGLLFDAVLDFKQLLQRADRADLEKLDDFASINVRECGEIDRPGTVIVADGLKPFVQRELRSDRRKGFVRNISSQSGLEQFQWQLSRCTPIPYASAPKSQNTAFGKLLEMRRQPLLEQLELRHAKHSSTLRRPIFSFDTNAPVVPDDMLVRVEIKEGGLHAHGFIAGSETVIFPAEYRGIAIRVCGVQIGDAHYLGAEYLLTGANKAALSQITGEINILAGLDAADTLNPGRESFYEESEQYKILRRHIIGEGEHIGGLLWHHCFLHLLHERLVRQVYVEFDIPPIRDAHWLCPRGRSVWG